MGSNFISKDATIFPSVACIYDSTIAYSADFSVNGEVDGWTYYNGIHTYGVWRGFLFGTLYESYGTIGRHNVFMPINATTHYALKITMKYNAKLREASHVLPTQGKIRWRTLANTAWDSQKEKVFDINADNKWHVYALNMGVEQWWQGDINDLRIWPVIADAQDGDEFFIRAIEVSSSESHACLNTNCDKFVEYEHPCPWIGERGYCESTGHEENKRFTVEDGTEFIININSYGNEIIKVNEVLSGTGYEVANKLAKTISRVDIGGYAEVQVIYTDENKFKIFAGTFVHDSEVEVLDNYLSRYLNFFDSNGSSISSKAVGSSPASGYSPFSSYRVKTHQMLSLFDNNEDTGFYFNPFGYSVEGGRRNWLESSVGLMTSAIAEADGDLSSQIVRSYFTIDGAGKTLIDFNHPFNTSGRITKIYAACTLDRTSDILTMIDRHEERRILIELSGAKIMVFRPKRDGTLDVIHEFDLNDRNPDRDYDSELYSVTQEYIEIDVDVFVNRGDFLGIYNANLYVGKSITGGEADAQYFKVTGKPSGNFNPGRLHGDGAGGLLLYARGDATQRRLVLDIDLRGRYNIENIEVKGLPQSTLLEYNIASCLDINWKCDLFGEQHWTSHANRYLDGFRYWYQRPNTYYGLNRLNDNLKTVPDGLACDSYSIINTPGSAGVGPWSKQIGGNRYNYSAGPGIVPTNPYYFWVNGDEEWLGIWLHAEGEPVNQSAHEFDYDPIAIYLHFPFEKEKQIYKLKMYFKEKFNFRSFAFSTYRGYADNLGNADDPHYDLIQGYTAITLDGNRYGPDLPGYNRVDKYLFNNPSIGHALKQDTGEAIYEWDPVLSDVVRDFGGETGYFITQEGEVANAAEWEQARSVDWQTIQHEWEPVECKGFRIYCDFHRSSKICEIELYGVAQDVGSSFAGGINISYSIYGDVWWPTESTQQNDELVEVYIGDTPRYITIEFLPIVETRYDDILLNVRTEDIYVGDKGCEYNYYLDHSKLGGNNESQLIKIENTYGEAYDLYVDIVPDKLVEDGLIFYSKLNDEDSITNPVTGPDARYYKLSDHEIKNYGNNCAINCNSYGLGNLIEGKAAYYSYDKMLTWTEFGDLSSGDVIDFHNLMTTTKTFITLPLLSRNRYWKFGFKSIDPSVTIREMKIYDENDELYLDIPTYHDLNKTYEEGYVSYRAPHLYNDSVTGSYYVLAEDQYITVDLGDYKTLKNIELTHDGLADYSNIYAGIDKYTKLCLRAWVDNTGGHLDDVSYYEHSNTMYGSTYIDGGYENIQLNADFGCLTDWVNWEVVNNEFSSTFDGTCASGTVVSGTYEYPGYFDFHLACSNWSRDRLKYDLSGTVGNGIPKEYSMWQNVPFKLDFKINFTTYSGTDSLTGSMSVGLFNEKPTYNWSYNSAYLEYWTGPQIVFEPASNEVQLAVRSRQVGTERAYLDRPTADYRARTSTTGLQLNTDYYCRLTSLGSGVHRDDEVITYKAEFWLDTWDGSNKDMELTLNTALFWEIHDIGVGSNCFDAGSNNYTYDASHNRKEPTWLNGRISDLTFVVDYDVQNYPWRENSTEWNERVSIRIPNGRSNYVSIPPSDELLFEQKRHTIDFHVKFNTLPDVGDYFTLIEAWDSDYYSNSVSANPAEISWSLRLYNTGTWYRLEWWVVGQEYTGTVGEEVWLNGWKQYLEEYNGMSSPNMYIPHFICMKNKWYHLVFQTGGGTSIAYRDRQGFNFCSFFDISGRNQYDDSYPGNRYIRRRIPLNVDIKIGEKFDGWIAEPRISRGNEDTRFGTTYYGGSRFRLDSRFVPAKPYEKLYTFSIYVSDDNQFFGHYADVDTMFENSYSYFLPSSIFAEKYNTYFAVDLGKRHELDIIRHYGADSLHSFTYNTNMIFSNINTDDPGEAFQTEFPYDPDDSFEGWDGELPDSNKWSISGLDSGTALDYLRLRNGYLESIADNSISNHTFQTVYSIQGNFDIEVKWGRTPATPDYPYWESIFKIKFSNGDNGETSISINVEYDYNNPSPYYYMGVIFNDNGVSTTFNVDINGLNDSGMRIVRERTHFFCYYYDNGWQHIADLPIHDTIGKDVLFVQMGTTALGINFTDLTVINYYKDFKVNSATKLLVRSDYSDARWLAVEMLNGDDNDRYIEKMGVYPIITRHIIPGGNGYNCNWDSLGSSLTFYSTSRNLALGVTVSGSSYFDEYGPDKTVDGIIGSEFRDVWATDDSDEQWLWLDLGEEKQIYRIKLYHGYDNEDSDYMIKDYKIQVSTNNTSFTTIFDISNNDSFERTHDLTEALTVRYVRLYINSYDTMHRVLGPEQFMFAGAVLREIEVYEYYGFSYVSSEEYPIVAINLRDQFYVDGHSLVGLYGTDIVKFDWDNDDSNFTYSDSVFDDPRKISFRPFGSTPNYEQWVVVKRDTASYYNADPAISLGDYGVDYLKHVLVSSSVLTNPVDYWWWWNADISSLSSDYGKPTELCGRSLRIDYPASTALETVSFMEGSNFGIDSDIARRDGIFLRLYIEDINKLDTSEGYFYFGGLDGTLNPKPVEYRWNFTSFSGVLETGWNTPYFRFRTADDVVYTEASDREDEIHPLMREYMTMQTVGLKFKGVGQPITLNIDGFMIKRNHFMDYSRFGQGLYLTGSDYLTCPLSEISFNAGTIEFWLRPDCTFFALDEFRRIKNRSLFNFNNVTGEVFGMMFTSGGIAIYFGDLAADLRSFVISELSLNTIDELFHFGIVFSNNGKHIGADNSTIRLYVNNFLVAVNYDTWPITDNKSFKFTLGGKGPLALTGDSSTLFSSSLDSVISYLRIYNYCKTDFSDSLENMPDGERIGNLILPSKLIEISRDNNLTFHKVGDSELPFCFEQVNPGSITPIYVRSIVPSTLTGYEDRTSGIVASWHIAV